MIEDEKVILPAPTPPAPLPLPISSPTVTSIPTSSSPSSSPSSSSLSSTHTPTVTLPVHTSDLTALAVKAENDTEVYREVPEQDSEFILVTAKIKAVPQKSVIKPVINNTKQKNNRSKNGNGQGKVIFLGNENKNKIIDKKSGTKVSDPGPVPTPVLVPAVSAVVKASTVQQSTYVFSPITSVTPDNHMRELFSAFQNKMSANRSNSNGNCIKNNYNAYNNNSNNNYSDYNDDNSSSNNSNSSSRTSRTDSSNSVRASSSDPVQFAAEVAASGVRTTVIGTRLSLFSLITTLHLLFIPW